MQNQEDLRNNMIINAGEPKVVQRVLDIYNQWGVQPIGQRHSDGSTTTFVPQGFTAGAYGLKYRGR